MTEEKIREIVRDEIRKVVSKTEEVAKALLAVMSENRELSVGLIEELAALMLPGPSVYGNGFNRAVDLSMRKTQSCRDDILGEIGKIESEPIALKEPAESVQLGRLQVCDEIKQIIKRRIGGIDHE